jgi:hypothetical protein
VQRAGRNIMARPDELNRWLQRSSGQPLGTHVVTSEADLMKDLRASLDAKKRPSAGSRRPKQGSC